MQFKERQTKMENKLNGKDALVWQIKKVIRILEEERFELDLKNSLLTLVYKRYKKALDVLDRDEDLNKIVIAGGVRAYVDSFNNTDEILLEAMGRAESLLKKYKEICGTVPSKMQCHCALQDNEYITSSGENSIIVDFLSRQLSTGIFKSIPVSSPYCIRESTLGENLLYADKWYKCNVCDTLWEYKILTSREKGFIRKFKNDTYTMLNENNMRTR